jgi:hypothetical protein
VHIYTRLQNSSCHTEAAPYKLDCLNKYRLVHHRFNSGSKTEVISLLTLHSSKGILKRYKGIFYYISKLISLIPNLNVVVLVAFSGSQLTIKQEVLKSNFTKRNSQYYQQDLNFKSKKGELL